MPQLNIRSGWQSSPPTLDNGPLSAALPSPGNVRMRPEADLAAPKAKYTNSFGSLKPRRLGPDWRVECLHHLGRE